MNQFRRSSYYTFNPKLYFVSVLGSFFAMLVFAMALIFPLLFGGEYIATPAMSKDVTPPIIEGVEDFTIYVGESPAYRKNIKLSDDSEGQVLLEIDSSAVILTEPGSYPVIYTATDEAGNKTNITIYLTIEVYFPQEKELEAALDLAISKIIIPGMSIESKVRAVYSYVQGNIAFVDSSDKSNWKAEAYRSLFITNTGDCFSFFAASKAFFERLGIENLDIERPRQLAEQMQQTHYWSMVNISEDPNQKKWYHYDSCRLRSEYNHSGCLLTETQIEAYNCVRENFYRYNASEYPNVCENIITPTPELEEFYNKN